jgi:hypothetical protein
LHVPDEIVLSYAQVQGLKGAEAVAGASGRALLWAYTSPELSPINRALGDPALLESNAQLLAELLADPQWLSQYFGVSVDQNYAAWRCLDRLYVCGVSWAVSCTHGICTPPIRWLGPRKRIVTS